MLQDPNVERLIENAIKPLRKAIIKLSNEVNKLKSKDITTHDLTDLDQARDDYYNRDKLCRT